MAQDPKARPSIEIDTDLAPLSPTPGFLEASAAYGLSFSDDETERYGLFLAHMLDVNTRMNLTGITDPGEAWIRHVFDALTIVPVLADLPDGSRVIDVGSGGGVPGLVLAIAMPNLRFTLLDATAKKCSYLEQLAAWMRLANVRVLCGRAEALGQDRGQKTGDGREGAHRSAYDCVTARAVGALNVLLELTTPFAKPGGLCVYVKGAKADDELADAKAALHALHCAHAGTVETPTGRLVVVEKLRETPRAYPRRDGEPKRDPIR
ncbi:MAG: 16S rRNA (guanine(527)-N(7))-methyltransferase RsmG [Planctomycetota bacterium]